MSKTIAILGLALSVLSLHFFCDILLHHRLETFEIWHLIPILYILFSCGATYELYWGLKLGNRRQCTPWLIMKFSEITLITAAVGAATCCKSWYYQSNRYLKAVYNCSLLLFNCLLLFLVIVKSTRRLKNVSKTYWIKVEDTKQEVNVAENY